MPSPDWMVGLGRLPQELENYSETAGTAASPLTTLWQRDILEFDGPRLVRAPAGIVLLDLNTALHRLSLAMPTLGGSQGQTLAGAISTSTHGSDRSVTPLPDLVRAVHLVTRDGQELWVESSTKPLTTDRGLLPTLDCDDVQVIRDDDLLRALQVSVGRFGVIYEYVLEVRRRFDLAEWATPSTWPQVATALREGLADRDLFGPLADILPPPPRGSAFAGRLGDSRHLEFLLNSRDGDQLWVRQRWELGTNLPLAVPGPAETEVLDLPTVPRWVLKTASSVIRLGIPAVLAAYPVIGIGYSVYMEARAIELDALALSSTVRSDYALVTALNALWACDYLGGYGVVIDELAHAVFDGRPELAKSGKSGVSWQVMSGLNAGDPNGTRVNSIEMVFDAFDPAYIDFLDALTVEGHDHRQSGYISIRYSKKSDALLSMHNVESSVAVSIEVASLAGFEGNGGWMREVEARGIALGGRPHWGQHNTLQAYQVAALYGDRLQAWRDQLVRVVGMTRSFSNDYTDQRGLEPVNLMRSVSSVRRTGGRITHLCHPGAYWSPASVEQVIASNTSPGLGRVLYQIPSDDPSVPARVISVARVLTTAPDETISNNLRNLPTVPERYEDFPDATSTRRQVTSVTRNRWGGVTGVCNDAERWTVSREAAFAEISSDRVEYFIDRGGAITLLQAKTHLYTYADGIVENNLESLPSEI
ncbi:MAG: FAD-binding protein [Mycetocola sp.]